MSRIVAGKFQTLPDAQHAVTELRAQLAEEDIDLFYTGAPGQHGAFPIGGDEHADPSAQGAERSTLKGAAIGAGLGLLAGAVAGPLGAAAGAAVGGYTGSLAGTMKGLGETAGGEDRHGAGVMVAVNVAGNHREKEISDILARNGASPVEAVDGEWGRNGWADFNPVTSPASPPANAQSRIADTTMPQAVYRVFPGGHGHWNVFEGDLGKLLSEFNDRDEAIDYAASLARMKSVAVVETYRAGGVLESSRVFNNHDRKESV
jgi:hypothetical protein